MVHPLGSSLKISILVEILLSTVTDLHQIVLESKGDTNFKRRH